MLYLSARSDRNLFTFTKHNITKTENGISIIYYNAHIVCKNQIYDLVV